MTDVLFVMAPGRRPAAEELVRALRDELEAQDVATAVVAAPGPPRRGCVPVVVGAGAWAGAHGDAALVLRRAVLFELEPPGTADFDATVALAQTTGAPVLHAHPDGVLELRALGLPAVPAPWGWTPRWCDPALLDGDLPGARDVDVLHLGAFTERRDRALARGAYQLARHRCHLLLGHPPLGGDAASPDEPSGPARFALLRRARVLLRVHHDDPPFHDPRDLVQAACAGALLVAEHGSGLGPLRAGEHLLSGRAEALTLLATGILADEDRRTDMVRDAFAHVREAQPLATTASRIAEVAANVDAVPPRRGPDTLDRAQASAPPPHAPAPPAVPPGGPMWSSVTSREESALRAALQRTRVELLSTRRELAWLRARQDSGRVPDRVRVVARSVAYAGARPRVSVICSLHDYAQHIAGALGSCTGAFDGELEIVVVDDASNDDSLPVVEGWLHRHDDVPALIARHPVNRGLSATRNTALDFARAPYVFVLDADNEVAPHGLQRLAEALDDAPDATFAYGIIERFDAAGPVGLASVLPWRPERLRLGNFVDAMAMLRRDRLVAAGGYSDDAAFALGLEDYDLWCRLAEAGHRGVAVPEIVGRYRVSPGSMIAGADISRRAAMRAIIERAPKLMAGVEPPL